MKKIEVKCTLSRWASSNEIHFVVYDEASKIEFLDITIPAESLANMLTGLAHVPAIAEVVGLENVGKTRIVKKLTVEIPTHIDRYNRKDISQWIENNSTTLLPGHTVSSYVGSQDSITYDPSENKTRAHLVAYKYEEPE